MKKWLWSPIIMLIALMVLSVITFTGIAQNVQPKRLSCEEMIGGLYVANAQLAEQLRETSAKLAEAQAELAKTAK